MRKYDITKKQGFHLVLLLFILACPKSWAGANIVPDEATLAAKIAAKEQLTDVPTIYIDVDGITDETTLKQILYKIRKSNADEEEIAPYSTATITVVDNSAVGTPQHLESFTDQVQIKVRGNSTASAGNGKVPYRLKFAKKGEDGISHKHDLLGHGYSKRNWTLIANNYDGSLIRNAVTYHVGKYVGMDFCPGYKFVDLVISGLYRGSYMVSDHCETGTNRVDVTDESTDWYLEFTCWGSMAECPYVGQGDGDDHFVSIKNPEPTDEASTTQLKSDVQAWRKEWISAFNSGNWQAYNDVESLVKFYIANEIIGDLDSYFVIKGWTTPGGKLHWGPLWDKDLAYGNYSDASDVDKSLANFGKTNFEWVFKNNLFANKEFLKKAKVIIDQLIEDGLYDKLVADIDNIVASMPQSVALNYNKWNLSSIENGYVQSSNYDDHVQSIKTWLSKRITNVQTWIDGYVEAVGGVDDVDEPGGEVTEGLTYLGQGVKWNSGEYVYKYQGSSSSMVTGATMTIELVSDGSSNTQSYGIYMDSYNLYSSYKGQYWPNPLTVTITLTDEDVNYMKNNGYMFTLITYGLTCSSITLTGGEGGNNGGGEIATRGQLTDVPTIYIDADGTIDADVWGTASIEVYDQNNMIGGDFTLASTGLSIKYKGDGTAEKPSYRLKFTKKQAFLGTKSGTYKQWVLQANDDDPTMLRNALTKELGDQMGFAFTPGYQFADVYVNDTYMGTYQITDRVKVESGRVLANDKDNDWLVQVASVGEVDTRTDGNGDWYIEGDTTTPYLIIKNPDKDDLTADQITALTESVRSYFNDTFWNDIENNVDQASFVNWYISSEILAAYKQLSSTYTYRDATNSGKLFFGPLNGNEKAYDNNTKYPMDMSDIDTEGSYNGMIFTRADYGVMRNKLQTLWQEEWFKEAVLAKWNTIYGSDATTDVKAALLSKLTTLANEIAQTKEYNYKAMADGGAGWTLDGSYDDEVVAISTYLNSRFAYLDKKFKELASASNVLIGDANGDGRVDVTDLIVCVNYVLEKNPTTFFFDNADADGNGEITMNDVTIITNIILNQ